MNSTSIIKLFLAVIILTCVSDVYANDMKAFDKNIEEVETMELKDQLEEEKEISKNDLDEDDALQSFHVYNANTLNNYIHDQKNLVLLLDYSGIILPPPEQ